MTPALPSPLALVCHDEGALQLMLPWLDLDAIGVHAFLQGPALALWQTRHGQRGQVGSIAQALDGAELLLSGTSWTSDLEHHARLQAAQRGLRSVGVLDHWLGYAARFQREGHRVLPDEIWVVDAEACALARATFPGHDVRLQPNLHLLEQVQRLSPCPDPRRFPAVLVLMEQAGSDWGRDQPGEVQALEFLLAQSQRLGLTEPLSLRLRPMDGDGPERWAAWMSAQRGQHLVTLDHSTTLAEAIDGVAWVAGLESPALVLAQAAGRRAVCLQPPWAPRSRLPQRGLIHLRDLVVRSAAA